MATVFEEQDLNAIISHVYDSPNARKCYRLDLDCIPRPLFNINFKFE